jgi:hypothetical protein
MTYANNTDRIVRVVEYDPDTGIVGSCLESVRYSGKTEEEMYTELVESSAEKGYAMIRLDNTVEMQLPKPEKIKVVNGQIVENDLAEIETADWDIGWGVWNSDLHSRDFS